MPEFLAAAMITLCMSDGLFLRYAPFRSVTTDRQKRTVSICYAALSLVNLVGLTAALWVWGLQVSFTYLRYGGILYGAILTLVNILVIRGWTREHIFVYGMVITFHYLLLTIPNFVVTFLPEMDVVHCLFVVLGVYAVALLLTHWPLRRLACHTVEPFLHLDTGEYWSIIWLLPLVLFATKFLNLGGTHDSGSIRQLLSSALYAVMMILICVSVSRDLDRMRRQQTLEKQLEAQKLHYTELKVRVEDARKTSHDFKHHIAAIHHYMDIDDKEGLRGYCNELLEHTGGKERIPYTGNAAADGVLYHYMQQARRDDIQFHCAGTIHSQGIADVDLCVLLGNALDNALTACRTVPRDRSISVISQSDRQLLSVMVRNTFDGQVLSSDDTLLSRKRDSQPGVGIASMRRICQRYGGSLDMRWDERTFTVMFILPLE